MSLEFYAAVIPLLFISVSLSTHSMYFYYFEGPKESRFLHSSYIHITMSESPRLGVKPERS